MPESERIAVAFYRDRVYPHLVSTLGNPKPIADIRQRIVPLAEGNVLEIGVGAGVNFAHYDAGRVQKIFALEPNPGMLLRAAEQQRRTNLDVEFLDLPGERLPLKDATMDTVLSTFTMCTIPGIMETLRGIRRVLKPVAGSSSLSMGSLPILPFSDGRSESNLSSGGHLRDAM
jgi:ubiquinone/menaquinone biosynthesis C-methylase UbiE